MIKQLGLQGIEELTVKFGSLKYDVKYKGGRFALRKAANFVAEKARQGAIRIDDPKTAEKIAKNIVVRWGSRRFKSTGDLMFRIGVLGGARDNSFKAQRRNERRRAKTGASSLSELGELEGAGKNNPGGDTFHWRFVEYGKEGYDGHPFMRPALANHTAEATNEFVSQYKKSIDRAIKKAKK